MLLAGLILLGAGLAGLLSEPGLVQYAFLPSRDQETDYLSLLRDCRSAMGESFPLLTLHAQKNQVTLSAGDLTQSEICLYLTGPSWNEVNPRRLLAGRPVSNAEAERGDQVIVLDQETAFRFFGEEDPIGKTVSLGDTKLEVIGVAVHSRRIGETGSRAAWAPLGTVRDPDLMVLSAPACSDSSLLSSFRTHAEESFGTGTLISLPKEKTAAAMLPRIAAIVFALMLLKRWITWLTGFLRRKVNLVREESRRRYAARLIPFALVQFLPVVLLLALTIGAGYLLAAFAMEPIRIFPEYVPESLGNFAAWGSRFWDLTAAAASPVSLKTPELAEIQFYSGLIRWGTVLALLGIALLHFRKPTIEQP